MQNILVGIIVLVAVLLSIRYIISLIKAKHKCAGCSARKKCQKKKCEN